MKINLVLGEICCEHFSQALSWSHNRTTDDLNDVLMVEWFLVAMMNDDAGSDFDAMQKIQHLISAQFSISDLFAHDLCT